MSDDALDRDLELLVDQAVARMKAEYALSPRHALYCGWVMGLAEKYDLPFWNIVDGDGNYTNRVTRARRHCLLCRGPLPTRRWWDLVALMAGPPPFCRACTIAIKYPGQDLEQFMERVWGRAR